VSSPTTMDRRMPIASNVGTRYLPSAVNSTQARRTRVNRRDRRHGRASADVISINGPDDRRKDRRSSLRRGGPWSSASAEVIASRSSLRMLAAELGL
jgi:hypothetical protein